MSEQNSSEMENALEQMMTKALERAMGPALERAMENAMLQAMENAMTKVLARWADGEGGSSAAVDGGGAQAKSNTARTVIDPDAMDAPLGDDDDGGKDGDDYVRS